MTSVESGPTAALLCVFVYMYVYMYTHLYKLIWCKLVWFDVGVGLGPRLVLASQSGLSICTSFRVDLCGLMLRAGIRAPSSCEPTRGFD